MNKIEIKEGVVFHNGEEIGIYDAASNVLHCPKRISPALYTPIREAIGKKPDYDFGTPNEAPSSEDIGSGLTSQEAPPEGASTTHEGAGDAAPSMTATVTPVADTPAPPSIDPEPSQDWDKGDKTPAYALWLIRTNPGAALKRYANRRMPDEVQVALEDAAAELNQ